MKWYNNIIIYNNRDCYLKWNWEYSSQKQFKIVWNFINEKLKVRKE